MGMSKPFSQFPQIEKKLDRIIELLEKLNHPLFRLEEIPKKDRPKSSGVFGCAHKVDRDVEVYHCGQSPGGNQLL